VTVAVGTNHRDDRRPEPGEQLVGRREETTAITAALKRHDLAGVVLVGEPGVGKTRLLEAALDVAHDAGFGVVRVTGSRALSDLPLAAFAALLPGRPVGNAGDLLVLRGELKERAGGRPLLLGVDDAHLLDDASAAVVHQLAADLTAFVVATLRRGEIPPDAITTLWKDRLVERIDVGPLSRHEVLELAAATLGAPLAPDVEDELWRRSAGNPMFARELALAAREGGSLVLRDGVLVRAGDLPAPSSVLDLVGTQLSVLGDEPRRAVQLLALAGPLDVEVLEQLVDADALVELEAARIVTAEERNDRLEVRFSHPLHADAVRHSTGRLVARKLRRELADVLEADPRSDDVLRVVTLRLDAGGTSSVELLAQATRVAMRRNHAELAERLAAAMFDQAPTLGSAVALAAARVEQGRFGEAAAALADRTIDSATATEGDIARAALLRAQIRFWGFGRSAPALAGLHAAAATAPRPQRIVLRAAAAAIEATSGRPREALTLAAPGSPEAATPIGEFAVLTALMTAGRPSAAIQAVRTPAGTSASAPANAAYGLALVESGRIAEAAQLAIDAWETAVRAGDLTSRVAWGTLLGVIDLFQGCTVAARRWFEEAAQLAVATAASNHGRRRALGGALLSATQLGDIDGARALRDRIDAMGPHEAGVHEILGNRGRAWLRAAEGDVDGAVDALFVLADRAIENGVGGHAVRLLTDAARLGRPGPAAARLEAAGIEVDGDVFPVLIGMVRALAARDGEALAGAAERLVAVGSTALAAEAAAGAWTIASEQHDDPRVVAARARRAQELRAPVAHLATPAFATAPVEVPLSRREREIATLVAGGRTSREVAEDLVIGVRTVESHLGRVYEKLGVRSRVELADALGLELSA
jgi:DNA-binding CsgD family transcriptional regulator